MGRSRRGGYASSDRTVDELAPPKTANRTCESCGGAMANRQSRQRNEKGQLVCDSCKANPQPQWTTTHGSLSILDQSEMRRREAEAITSIVRVRKARHAASEGQVRVADLKKGQRIHKMDGSVGTVESVEYKGMRNGHVVHFEDGTSEPYYGQYAKTAGISTLAHDSGDQAIINHCPFCGSGAVVGNSDGSAACDFCHSSFTVQVQPAHPFMPQTIDGESVVPPGMPGGEETELSAPSDPAVEEEGEDVAADPLGDADPNPPSHPNGPDGKPPAGKAEKPFPPKKPADKKPSGGGNQPPWLKNKASSTASEYKKCGTCKGFGWLPGPKGERRITCQVCNGTGHVEKKQSSATPRCGKCGQPLVLANGLGKEPDLWVHAYPEEVEDGHEAVPSEKQSSRTASLDPDDIDTVTEAAARRALIELGHDADEAETMTDAAVRRALHQRLDKQATFAPYLCEDCGNYRTREECTTCAYRAENKGYRKGPTFVDYLMHGLFPSGASASFRTEDGRTLDTEAYMARLALENADDRDAVLDQVRMANMHEAAVRPFDLTAEAAEKQYGGPGDGPGWLKGERNRCEASDAGARPDTRCGARAVYWDGHRYLCSEHLPEGVTTQAAKGLVRHEISAEDIQEGDFLDISGKIRVDKRHPRTDKVLVRTQTIGARSPSVQQWEIGEQVKVWRRP